MSGLSQGVAVASRNGVAIAATVLAVVGGVRWIPRLGVHGAVKTLGHGILAQHIGIEERASGKGAIGGRVAAVVCGRCFASGGACCGIVTLRLGEGKVFVSNIGVAIGRSVDGTAKFLGTSKAVDWVWWGGLVVAVGAGDDDVEFGAILAPVGGLVCGDGGTPEGTLVVGGGWRVGAQVGICINAGVALDVHVDGFTAIRSVAQRGTL